MSDDEPMFFLRGIRFWEMMRKKLMENKKRGEVNKHGHFASSQVWFVSAIGADVQIDHMMVSKPLSQGDPSAYRLLIDTAVSVK